MSLSLEDLTLDDLQNGYYIYQLKDGFRFGVDAVLLSNFAAVRSGAKVLDMGTGTGILPILLSAKTKAKHITGIDIQEINIDIANLSREYNKLEDRLEFVHMDLKDCFSKFGGACFDAVVSNPPYMAGNDGKHSPNMAKAIARHEIMCTLEDVIKQASYVLKSNGSFYMIHRPYRLGEIMRELIKYNLEPKRMQLIYPYVDKEPTMVLIEALKCGRCGMVVEKPYIMYEK